jgi:hypothetical protein
MERFIKDSKGKRNVLSACYHGHCYHLECKPDESIGVTISYIRTEKTYCNACNKPLWTIPKS